MCGSEAEIRGVFGNTGVSHGSRRCPTAKVDVENVRDPGLGRSKTVDKICFCKLFARALSLQLVHYALCFTYPVVVNNPFTPHSGGDGYQHGHLPIDKETKSRDKVFANS